MQIPLPELVRRQPSEALRATVRVPTPGVPPDVDGRVLSSAQSAGLKELRVEARGRYLALLPWRTQVYGLITRGLTEELLLTVTTSHVEGCVRLECLPSRTHDAHAGGAAGVLVAAAAVGLASFSLTGLMPAATIAIGGGFWADATRTMAMTTLQRRLEQVATDVASAIWPGVPPWPDGAVGVGPRLPSSHMP